MIIVWIILGILLFLILFLSCLLFRNYQVCFYSKLRQGEDQTKLDQQVEKVEYQPQVRHSEDQFDIRQEQDQIELLSSQHEDPEDKTKIEHVEGVKRYHQKQESGIDYQEKHKTKNYHHTRTDYQEGQTKIYPQQISKPEYYHTRPDHHPNLDFYRNVRRSEPDGDYIENILKHWFGDYQKLERHHGYIQWLFPNRVPGLNREAFCLNDYEIQEISNNELLKSRVIRSFRLMLDFYGMSMDDNCKFSLSLSDSDRIKNLKKSHHNFLRITRILTALGEFGLMEEQSNWLLFLESIVKRGILEEANYSLQNFWIPAVQYFERFCPVLI